MMSMVNELRSAVNAASTLPGSRVAARLREAQSHAGQPRARWKLLRMWVQADRDQAGLLRARRAPRPLMALTVDEMMVASELDTRPLPRTKAKYVMPLSARPDWIQHVGRQALVERQALGVS